MIDELVQYTEWLDKIPGTCMCNDDAGFDENSTATRLEKDQFGVSISNNCLNMISIECVESVLNCWTSARVAQSSDAKHGPADDHIYYAGVPVQMNAVAFVSGYTTLNILKG